MISRPPNPTRRRRLRAMVSIMDFLPTVTLLVGVTCTPSATTTASTNPTT